MALQILRRIDVRQCCIFSRAGYAKKAGIGGKISAKKKAVEVEVVTDPVKLSKYLCGGNINKEGEDPLLKPDSEYPKWLWKLKIDKKQPELSELDPETHAYWRKLKVLNMRWNNRINKLRAK